MLLRIPFYHGRCGGFLIVGPNLQLIIMMRIFTTAMFPERSNRYVLVFCTQIQTVKGRTLAEAIIERWKVRNPDGTSIMVTCILFSPVPSESYGDEILN